MSVNLHNLGQIATICLRHISSWSHLKRKDLHIAPVVGGCSRLLFKVQAPPGNEVEVLLFRLLNTQSYLSDYQRESNFMITLSKKGITEGLYYMCDRYRLEKFIIGKHPAKDDSLFSEAVLKTLSKMHQLSLNEELNVISQLRKWLPRVLELSPELREFDLESEITYIERKILEADMMFGLVHSDLHRLNMFVKEDKSVMLCDFEYTGTNPVAYDFANSFFELSMDNSHDQAPYFKRIKDNYPSREDQMKICKKYFELREIEDVNLDTFLEHIQICTLASHMMWSLWATLAFDDVGENIRWGYKEYGQFRLQHYFYLKKELE